jgi:cystathionine beta-lyase/cystathionine gamma-synthase
VVDLNTFKTFVYHLTFLYFVKNLKLHVFALAESLGAVESLAESPSLMTHASVPDDQRAKLGIDDSLIRLSVGVESCADLIKDLDAALAAAGGKRNRHSLNGMIAIS